MLHCLRNIVISFLAISLQDYTVYSYIDFIYEDEQINVDVKNTEYGMFTDVEHSHIHSDGHEHGQYGYGYATYDYGGRRDSNVQNIPFFMPSIIPIEWDTSMKILPFCIETGGKPVNKKLLESAVDNVNLYLYSGNLDTTALYLYVEEYRDSDCPEDKLKISLVQNGSVDDAPGYCSRRFLDGTTERPKLLYVGCDITLNTCILQSSATFYNVLLHELLHVVGLDHPPEPTESVMSYGVRAKDRTLKQIRQDTGYVSVTKTDMNNIRAIVARDFPDAPLPIISDIPDEVSFGPYIPSINASKHMSGDDNYIVQTYADVDECWVRKNGDIAEVSSGAPTLSPTSTPTLSSSSSPSPSVTKSGKGKGKGKGKGNGKGKGKRKGKGKGKGNIPNITFTEMTLSPTMKVVKPKDILSENEVENGDIDFDTEVLPSISLDQKDGEQLNVEQFDVKTDVTPQLEINALEGDILIQTRVNPDIKISGNVDIQTLKMTTTVNPIIRILGNDQMIPVIGGGR